MARIIPHLNLIPNLSRSIHLVSQRPVKTAAGTTTQAASPQAASTQAASTPADSDPVADFRKLFNGAIASVGPPPPPPAPPTAESVFGPNPWLSNPTCMQPNGQTVSYNKFYFATPETAAKVAQMLGGKVVETYEFTPNGGAFAQQQPNQMVQLPDGRLVNPGLIASYYTHGYPQSYVDYMVACEVKNS